VVLESPGRDPILFDLGTGLRFYGLTQPSDGTFRGSALVSHLHWDHVQGIPVVYISDHQQPGPGATEVSREVLDLCEGADLLIHDAQYDHEEFAARPDWGHCTYDYAVEVAARAGVRRLVLFHHDPAHCDDRIDQILEQATAHAARRGIEEVLAAAEGLTISYGSSPQN
jgi:ribonuclease BN (tRNA processing enzyme)